MNQLTFTKMEGAGNDFVVIDNHAATLSKDTIISLAPRLCNRRRGIGADGLLALQPAKSPSLDYTMLYRNADGSDAGMCGNGARCLALFAARIGMGSRLSFNVHDVQYEARVQMNQRQVSVSFPFRVSIEEKKVADQSLYQLYPGTEHVVFLLEETDFPDNNELRRRGRELRYHPKFNPPGTNVNFIRGTINEGVQIKTYERGVEDLTLACGTGAIAGALSWHHHRGGNASTSGIVVEADGGGLNVSFHYRQEDHIYEAIKLSGPARIVFEGTYRLED